MRYKIIFFLFMIFLYSKVSLIGYETHIPINALTYSFFHVNIFHLLVNALSIYLVFNTKYKTEKQLLLLLIIGYVIAIVVYPLSIKNILGFSNVLFAIAGLKTPNFKSLWWRQKNVWIFIILTMILGFIPSISAITHIISFIIGIILKNIYLQLYKVCYDVKRCSR